MLDYAAAQKLPLKSCTFSFFETMHALLAVSETDDCRAGTGGTAFLDAATSLSPDAALNTTTGINSLNSITELHHGHSSTTAPQTVDKI